MRTSVIVCLFAGYAALLSARVGGAPPAQPAAQTPAQAQAPSQPALPEKHPKIEKPAAGMNQAKDKGEKPPPDFVRDVLPIIEDNCLRCHSAAAQKGGLILDTHEGIMTGGENGTVLIAGDAAKSRLVQMIRDEIEPKMPPKSTLRPEEIAVFAAWIDAGARDSTESPLDRLTAKIPSIAPEVALRPAINSVAFRPDGSELAVPGYREVRRVTIAGNDIARAAGSEARGSKAATGASPSPRLRGEGGREGAQAAPARTLTGAIDLVRSVAYSRDGKWIAGAGGIPGAAGEVLIWNAETGELAHTLKGHRDYVYQVVFNRRGTRLATCSYDRTVRVWDIETGRPTHVFREHTEAVYAVAFSPNDRWLASGAGDRSVKLWDLASGSRMFTLTEPTGVVQTLAFHPSGLALSASGADKTIRTWELTPTATQNRQTDGGEAETTAAAATAATSKAAGDAQAANAPATKAQTANAQAGNAPAANAQAANAQAKKTGAADDGESEARVPPVRVGSEARSIRGHNAPVLRIAYSPDGKWLASSDDDGVVKIWEAATGKEVRALEKQPDWAQGLDWSPDGTRLAIGRYDGTVGIYDAATGRRVSSLPLHASATRPAAMRPATARAKKAAPP
jgi:WD40 repeat protein